MSLCALPVLAGAVLCLFPACGGDSPRDAQGRTAEDRTQIQADIAALAQGKDGGDDNARVSYDLARDRLVRRGSLVENDILQALATSKDWGVRLGCVEVLQSIGTRACVAHLINVLTDSEPLVAYQADITLAAMLGRREIPKAGQPTGANGLPPVPQRDPGDIERDTERRLWATWHRSYGTALQGAWSAWWRDNESRAVIDRGIVVPKLTADPATGAASDPRRRPARPATMAVPDSGPFGPAGRPVDGVTPPLR